MATDVLAAPDRPRIGFGSVLSLIMLFLASAPVWIGKLAEDSKPLGVNPDVWVKLTLVVGVATVVGRMAQAAYGIYASWSTENPSKGLATWIGLGLTILAALPAFLGELTDTTKPLGVNPSLWVTAAVIVGVATTGGRMLQGAVVMFNTWRAGGAPVPPPVTGTTPEDGGGTTGEPPVIPGPPAGEPTPL